jgi:hypothetical protein
MTCKGCGKHPALYIRRHHRKARRSALVISLGAACHRSVHACWQSFETSQAARPDYAERRPALGRRAVVARVPMFGRLR